ncbi:hypothetical protein ACLKA6_008348 [Drosophila palustris]
MENGQDWKTRVDTATLIAPLTLRAKRASSFLLILLRIQLQATHKRPSSLSKKKLATNNTITLGLGLGLGLAAILATLATLAMLPGYLQLQAIWDLCATAKLSCNLLMSLGAVKQSVS